ncbi:hypothetical protein SAMN04488588_1628 [Geotoga petraea]|jgi:hypothetical protein|uniref:Uncharacterized protein n=1 Tax=Geotoga petraea TaxID=28234 RepID=A0A1G6NQG0_9BACT|nr:hypothetical protein SAMN04488588_1628 [Geotoga petraea]
MIEIIKPKKIIYHTNSCGVGGVSNCCPGTSSKLS